jgi:hypothetical protein
MGLVLRIPSCGLEGMTLLLSSRINPCLGLACSGYQYSETPTQSLVVGSEGEALSYRSVMKAHLDGEWT